MAMDLKEIENFIKEAMPDAVVEIQDLAVMEIIIQLLLPRLNFLEK